MGELVDLNPDIADKLVFQHIAYELFAIIIKRLSFSSSFISILRWRHSGIFGKQP